MFELDVGRAEAASLWAEAAVFADAAMQAGDPRGELLALELAARASSDPLEARRVSCEAQALREHHPQLAWPELPQRGNLRAVLRSGFVLAIELIEGADAGHPLADFAPLALLPAPEHRGLPQRGLGHSAEPGPWSRIPSLASALRDVLEHPACARLKRVQLGSAEPHALAASLACLADHGRTLDLLAIRATGPQQLRELGPALARVDTRALRFDYDRVTRLFLGAARERVSLPMLASFERLEALSLAGYLDLLPLADLPLTTLDCWCHDDRELERIVALPRLRRLSLIHDESVEPLVGAGQLEALALTLSHARIAPLVELAQLRALALDEPTGEAIEHLRQLAALERLELRGSLPVGGLARLDSLGSLEHLALNLGAAGPLLDLAPLAALPQLRSLTLDLGRADAPALRGCEALLQVRELSIIGRADLRWLDGTALDALAITGGFPPRQLPRLTELGPLRRLAIPGQLLRGRDATSLASMLPELEVLELHDVVETLTPDQFSALPRLRRLVLNELGLGRARSFAEELPEVEIEVTPAPRDLLGLASPFDWRAAGWPH